MYLKNILVLANPEKVCSPNMRVWLLASVTRFGDFWKFLATNLLSKEAQKYGDYWAILETIN